MSSSDPANVFVFVLERKAIFDDDDDDDAEAPVRARVSFARRRDDAARARAEGARTRVVAAMPLRPRLRFRP
jgi:hypothetical protein